MKKLLPTFLILIIVAVTIFIIYKVKTISGSQQVEISSDVSPQVLSVYQNNCARCHGKNGEGYDTKPVLHNNNYTVEQIKNIVNNGLDKMPAFPTIKDPVLTDLAKYVSNL